MVQALLEGRKTITRRTKGLEKFNAAPDSWRYDGYDVQSKSHYMELISSDRKFTEKYFEAVCPYQVGDVLWVRETFFDATMFLTAPIFKYLPYVYAYKANDDFIGCHKWKPSIFMPKEACRIFLKIKSIRVERLNTIRDKDAILEGINSQVFCLDDKVTIYENYLPGKDFYDLSEYSWNFGKETHSAPMASFCSLWESINGDGSWNSNPFVFVYEFERIEKPLDFN
jgi:hypothetical protein